MSAADAQTGLIRLAALHRDPVPVERARSVVFYWLAPLLLDVHYQTIINRDELFQAKPKTISIILCFIMIMGINVINVIKD